MRADGGDDGLTGHILDLAAVWHLLDGKSQYGREIVRQSVMRNTTLLLPALAAEHLAAMRPEQAEGLLAVPVVTIGALTEADAVGAGRVGAQMLENLRRVPRAVDAELPAVLAGAHAVLLSEARGGWRVITAAPSLYDGLGVRLEILP
ncbi:hypothetical protein SAMN05421505_114104 [Sinosporangium album]|uniref:PIN domain-containing protein n=1 Tax=Sinosporangium album TaxID=504805 RepID=A0A1G8BNB6_9ACTN|nr:hypothetical protein [Sinosporangium album]SDH34717.1 hypothetical protein SAMN05421505_114104 [Sinosporangium album]